MNKTFYKKRLAEAETVEDLRFWWTQAIIDVDSKYLELEKHFEERLRQFLKRDTKGN